MALKLGTKVVINKRGFGASPAEMGIQATIIGYRKNTEERFFKNGAYYLNPPIGNNSQYIERSQGWGIHSNAFAVLGGLEDIILKDTYFVITDYGNVRNEFKDEYDLNTVYKQQYSHHNITPMDPIRFTSVTPCFYFGYGETAKKANTRVRYANPEEMRLYIQKGSPVYVGDKAVTSFDKKHTPIGHSSMWDEIEASVGGLTVTSMFDNAMNYLPANVCSADNAVKIHNYNSSDSEKSLIVNLNDGQLLMDVVSGGNSFIDESETKEQRLERLTQGITMTKPVVIPVKKKSIKRLV